MGMDAPPKRRWFQVSLREVALLLLAFGFALAWWVERRDRLAALEPWRKIREAAESVTFASYPDLPPSMLKGHSTTETMEVEIDGGRVRITLTAIPSGKLYWPNP